VEEKSVKGEEEGRKKNMNYMKEEKEELQEEKEEGEEEEEEGYSKKSMAEKERKRKTRKSRKTYFLYKRIIHQGKIRKARGRGQNELEMEINPKEPELMHKLNKDLRIFEYDGYPRFRRSLDKV